MIFWCELAIKVPVYIHIIQGVRVIDFCQNISKSKKLNWINQRSVWDPQFIWVWALSLSASEKPSSSPECLCSTLDSHEKWQEETQARRRLRVQIGSSRRIQILLEWLATTVLYDLHFFVRIVSKAHSLHDSWGSAFFPMIFFPTKRIFTVTYLALSHPTDPPGDTLQPPHPGGGGLCPCVATRSLRWVCFFFVPASPLRRVPGSELSLNLTVWKTTMGLWKPQRGDGSWKAKKERKMIFELHVR